METAVEESKPSGPVDDENEHDAIRTKIYRLHSMLKILKVYAAAALTGEEDDDPEQTGHDIGNQVDAIRGVLLSLEQHFDSSATLDEAASRTARPGEKSEH